VDKPRFSRSHERTPLHVHIGQLQPHSFTDAQAVAEHQQDQTPIPRLMPAPFVAANSLSTPAGEMFHARRSFYLMFLLEIRQKPAKTHTGKQRIVKMIPKV
jgi:hypothetical protein